MDRMHKPGREGRSTGQDVAGAAREGAAEVVHESVAQGRDLYERLREQAADEAGAQVRRLAAGLRHLSTDLWHMGENAKPDSPAAPLVRQLAESGHRIADRMEHRRADELLDDARNFARSRPGMFLAGAALAGLAVSRLGRGVGAAGQRTEVRPADEGAPLEAPESVAAYAPEPALAPGEGPPPMPRLGASAAPVTPEPPATPPPTTGRGW
ncbi:hypothetical protein [Streptomyces sp. AN091965]|uniref:hypothetical protein n=1 Tax=Streptomyces sp. AN091965 TaxID=2927803 RepID=UPI001F62187D|nr:hypothetical protein [Streptomyces sp. AN091965]MCI3935091.1 hypothetical protein [Streptomyces sp. AN091965]